MLGLIQGVDGMGQKAESIRDIAVRKKSSCYRKCPRSHSRMKFGKQGKIAKVFHKILQISQQCPSGAKIKRRTLVVATMILYVLLEATITVLDVKYKKIIVPLQCKING
jgi:hypothetical protein